MLASSLRILAILAVAVGVSYIRARDLPWVFDVEKHREAQEKHKSLRATVGLTLEEFLGLIERGAVVIDTRPADKFEQGHLKTGGYPPVLNIPPEEVDANLERLEQLRGYELVLYCTSETCEFAEEVYIELEQYGYYGMKIYFPGWEGIQRAGLPTAAGADTWSGFEVDPNAATEGPGDVGADESTEPNAPNESEP